MGGTGSSCVFCVSLYVKGEEEEERGGGGV